MKRKIIALLLCIVCVVSLCFPVAADDDGYSAIISDIDKTCPTCGATLHASWGSTSGAEVELEISDTGKVKIPAGAGAFARIHLRCSSCGYEKTETRLLGLDFGAEKPGKLVQAPSGIGRKDLPGYADDKGIPSVDPDGLPVLEYTMLLDGYDSGVGRNSVYAHKLSDGSTFNGSWFNQNVSGNYSGSGNAVSFSSVYGDSGTSFYSYGSISYYLIAPYTGWYTLSCPQIQFTVLRKNASGSYIKPTDRGYGYGGTSEGWTVNVSKLWLSLLSRKDTDYLYRFTESVGSDIFKSYSNFDSKTSSAASSNVVNFSDSTIYVNKGSLISLSFAVAQNEKTYCNNVYAYHSISLSSTPKLTCQVASTSDVTINRQNNITINNNTWNGNIYVDNSTNLTYIYPQYTTVNEKNETVTNISNTPIIYNNETKKYYTYDTVTNNYYYITYEQPAAPTPSPSPSPAPTEAPSSSPSPSPSPAPVEPILPDTQNYIIPKMNSNTFTDEHGTWVASGSSKYSDVFDFFHAFDRSTSDFWETNASPSYLQIEIPDPENYYIDGYIMRISKFTNRYAKEWTLQGSDDGETWYDLDKQTGQNLSDLEEHKYPLALRKAYKYYRVNMSNYASSMCSLSHFNLLGYDAKDVVMPTPSPAPEPGGGSSGGDGGSGSGGSSGGSGSSWWDKLLDKLGSALIDGLLGAVSAVLKLIFKLLSTILSWIIWAVSRVFDLLPFLPPGLGGLLVGGVVVCFVIGIIKFIRG